MPDQNKEKEGPRSPLLVLPLLSGDVSNGAKERERRRRGREKEKGRLGVKQRATRTYTRRSIRAVPVVLYRSI